MKKPLLKLMMLCLLTCFTMVNAQDYKTMMDDPKYNVYDVIQKGNAYFKNRDKGKGSGYKQFQRWIIANEDRFYPSGERTKVDPRLVYYLGKSKHDFEATLKSSSGKILLNPVQDSEWEEIGPFVELKEPFSDRRNGNGRVDAIWVNPTNENHIYIGCRGGGLWATTNGGQSWTPKTDGLGITGIWSLAVNPNNTDEIYISTNVGGSGNYSIGIFKTTDGGNTWNPTGYALDIPSTYTRVHKILMNPSDTNMLFAATSNGLLKSPDGFQTFTTVLTGDITDIEFKPGDPSIVYATNKTNRTLYRSTDTGGNFTATSATATDPQVAVSAAAPNNVYFVGDKVSFKSTDNGLTFIQGGIPDAERGQYGGFAVSDTNPNLIINGSLDTYRSTNGGDSFTKVTNWIYGSSTGVGGNFVHADIREIEVVNGTIYLGTDGWLVKSTDGGLNYEVLTYTVGNHEIYQHGMGVSQSDDATLVVGVQDNGTSIWYQGQWNHWKGGDGGTSMIDHSDHNIIYGSLYNGDFKRTDTGGLTGTRIDLGDTKPGSLPPLIQHPTDPATIFLGEGSGQIWKSTNRGGSWTTIADLGVNDVIDEMAIAPSNADYIYASIKNRIWRTTDGGANWSEITSGLTNRVIKGIAVDYDDPNHVSVCFTGYANNEKAYTTSDGGGTWTNISAGLPNLTTSDIVYDNSANNALYIATDIGVYYKDDTLTEWQAFGLGLPNVVVNDLEIQHNTQQLYAATWGRGVWRAELVGEDEAPTSKFGSDTQSIFEGETINFTDESIGFPDAWSWTFEGGAPATSTNEKPSVTYAMAGTYKVTLTVTNAFGSDTKEVDGYVIVNQASTPVANFEVDTQTVFEGNFVNFTDTSTNLPSSWSWTFEGGTPASSTEQNPTVVYNTLGTYKVTLTATNQFGSDTKEEVGYITVTENQGSGPLQAHFNFQGDIQDSSSYSRDLIAVGEQNITYVNDKDGNANSAFQINGQYLENTYTGVGGTDERTVTAWIKTTNAGSRKTVVSWGENSTGQMWNVMVDNGNIRVEGGSCNVQNDDSTVARLDGDTWRHIAVTYNAADGTTMNTIKLYIDGVYYANQPDSGDSFSSETTVINTSTATNLRVGSAAYNAIYDWIGELDDVRVYSKALSAAEIVTVMNETPDMPPVANFVADDVNPFINETVSFTDTSSGTPTSWSWTFTGGSPAASTEQNPQVIYTSEGTYQVSLTVTNAFGTDTKTETNFITVTVPPAPTADFSANVTEIWEGEQITFSDESTDAPTEWDWAFEGGEPSTSTEQNPVVTYNAEGLYKVTLTVTNPQGSDTKEVVDYILVKKPVEVNLNQDNYSVSITSETCRNSNNGKISITPLADYPYTAVITGNGVNNSIEFGVNSPLSIENLSAGSYTICITVADAPDYEQCFTVQVNEPENLSVFSKVSNSKEIVSLDLAGSSSYHIYLNGETFTVMESSINLELNPGAFNVLKVYTNKTCQGVYEETFDFRGETHFFPNPAKNNINIVLSESFHISKSLNISIHTATGQRVYLKEYKEKEQSKQLTIPLERLKQGVYFINISSESQSKTQKIIKL
ncbi:Por secretion system C-terminal sorting domain-containing protein [Hyunsoonleella jejuensis]|uniref:Por secretion system C-terminal sorting domain-containing protein n=1 Tax=Hyunsoonleella jejuensis TaxID=419940 RepID=A0A1H9CDB6_9FLAO|nr:PKD domain-containing protein [Hyunsoonleella jejuensis]SEP99186.1 Por secretion system C-terminal sorting domain-containing protein [Hyunsoonleella jejuensis]